MTQPGSDEAYRARIAQLEQQVRELAATSERYHAIFEAANDAFFVHDLSGRFLDVNEEACRRLGYTRAELLSMSVRDLDSPSYAADFDVKMRSFLEKGSASLRTEHRTKDGRILAIELSSRVLTIDGQQLVISLARDVTERDQMQAAMIARNEQIAALNAIISERGRLGREIHDGLMQVLAYSSYKAHGTAGLLRNGQIEQALEALREMEDATQQAYRDARSTILELRTPITTAVGLLTAVRDYAERFEREWGIETRVVVAGASTLSFTPMAELQLLRIVHEALTNVRRHAQAKQASVHFAKTGDGALLTVEDDGKGFVPQAVSGQHYGLTSMSERAQSINGELQIDSAPGRGARVIVRVPADCLAPEAV